jgi:hypothetical protein
MEIRNKLTGAYAFAAAAVTAPITFLAAGPCGLACGGCPLGGACLLSSPVAFGFVLAVQSKGWFQSRGGKGADNEEKNLETNDVSQDEVRDEWKDLTRSEDSR